MDVRTALRYKNIFDVNGIAHPVVVKDTIETDTLSSDSDLVLRHQRQTRAVLTTVDVV